MIEPKKTSRAARKYGNRGAWAEEADHMRAHPGDTFVIERRPYPDKAMYALAAHARSGGYVAFRPAGAFESWVEREGPNLEVIAVFVGEEAQEAQEAPPETVAPATMPVIPERPESGMLSGPALEAEREARKAARAERTKVRFEMSPEPRPGIPDTVTAESDDKKKERSDKPAARRDKGPGSLEFGACPAEPRNLTNAEQRELARSKGWYATYQRCPQNWVLNRQADAREGINPWGEPAEAITKFLLSQPDVPGGVAFTEPEPDVPEPDDTVTLPGSLIMHPILNTVYHGPDLDIHDTTDHGWNNTQDLVKLVDEFLLRMTPDEIPGLAQLLRDLGDKVKAKTARPVPASEPMRIPPVVYAANMADALAEFYKPGFAHIGPDRGINDTTDPSWNNTQDLDELVNEFLERAKPDDLPRLAQILYELADKVNAASVYKAPKETEVRKLAKEKGYYLYSGHDYGCAPVRSRTQEQDELLQAELAKGPGNYDDAEINQIVYARGANAPYTLEKDNKPFLVRIRLAEAYLFLRDGTVPEGHIPGEFRDSTVAVDPALDAQALAAIRSGLEGWHAAHPGEQFISFFAMHKLAHPGVRKMFYNDELALESLLRPYGIEVTHRPGKKGRWFEVFTEDGNYTRDWVELFAA